MPKGGICSLGVEGRCDSLWGVGYMSFIWLVTCALVGESVSTLNFGNPGDGILVWLRVVLHDSQRCGGIVGRVTSQFCGHFGH